MHQKNLSGPTQKVKQLQREHGWISSQLGEATYGQDNKWSYFPSDTRNYTHMNEATFRHNIKAFHVTQQCWVLSWVYI
jgi:hypothetical protein